MDIQFKEVNYAYVAEKLFYDEMFMSFYYLDDGDLRPITSFKDFTEVVANSLIILKQVTKV